MLVVTSGDPLSTNIELMLKAGLPVEGPWPLVVVGSFWHWQDQARRLGLLLPQFAMVKTLEEARIGATSFLDVGQAAWEKPAETLSPLERGHLSVAGLQKVPRSWSVGNLAVVTGPIDKHACSLAGFSHPGQTEYFEALWMGSAVMTLAGLRLRVGLVTNHVALRNVAMLVTSDLIEHKLKLFISTLKKAFSIPSPRIAVVGLNPHASDQGLFGDEEERILSPTLKHVAKLHPEVTIVGPIPADTAFYRAYHGAYDGVLAMYHDQGLGPFKTVHFDDGINLSGGLPHLRVSPDHGPARDLFIQGTASPLSVKAAFDTAKRYLNQGESM